MHHLRGVQRHVPLRGGLQRVHPEDEGRGQERREPVVLGLGLRAGRFNGVLGPDSKRLSRLDRVETRGDKIVAHFAQFRLELSVNGDHMDGDVFISGSSEPGRLTATRTGPALLSDGIPPLPFEGNERSERVLELRAAIEGRDPNAAQQFWLELEHFIRRGDQILAATADDMGQIMP